MPESTGFFKFINFVLGPSFDAATAEKSGGNFSKDFIRKMEAWEKKMEGSHDSLNKEQKRKKYNDYEKIYILNNIPRITLFQSSVNLCGPTVAIYLSVNIIKTHKGLLFNHVINGDLLSLILFILR